MPALLNELRDGGLFKVRVDLGSAFDKDDPAEAKFAKLWGGHWVDLREWTAKEQSVMAVSQKQADGFLELLPSLIVKHSIVDSDGQPENTADVADVIASSSTLFNKVMAEYLNALPLVKRSAQSSAKPPTTS